MPAPDNPDNQKNDFEKVVDAARRGEQTEMGRLLEIYRGYLLTIARDNLAPDVSAKIAPSDLVQETLFQASHEFKGFRGSSDAELRGWLKQILTRELNDVHRYFRNFAKRDISREVRLIDDSNWTSHGDLTARIDPPSAMASRLETVRTVQDALNSLPLDYRRAIQLRNFEQLDFEEMGKRLDRSGDAARKLWWRAIRKLTEELQRQDSTIPRRPNE